MLRGQASVRTTDEETGSSETLEIIDEIDFESASGRLYPRSPREAIQPEAVPAPPIDMSTRRNPLFALFNGLLSLIVFGLVVAGAAYYFVKAQFNADGPLRSAKSVIIPKGEGVQDIAARLKREGVIVDETLFTVGVVLEKASAKLQAGEFLFPENASMRQVLDSLVDGKAILHKITIPEGRTSEQIVELLKENEILVGELTEIPEEGVLLPDTYKFTRGTSRQEVLQRMRSAHERALSRIWERRSKDLPVKTPEELVVLASIVEKETGKADERPRVASVFINRLRKSMRLQSDPTIIYGLVGGKGSLGRPILRSEIDRETPYNTYKIDGLPPTPIANPGLAALEATANPSRTGDLYFVADGTGGHVFAPTLEEHNRNVARWRKVQQELQKANDAAATTPPTTTIAPDSAPPKNTGG
mgnify:CR=1 FL=1